jgi:hypothetical protein
VITIGTGLERLDRREVWPEFMRLVGATGEQDELDKAEDR